MYPYFINRFPLVMRFKSPPGTVIDLEDRWHSGAWQKANRTAGTAGTAGILPSYGRLLLHPLGRTDFEGAAEEPRNCRGTDGNFMEVFMEKPWGF